MSTSSSPYHQYLDSAGQRLDRYIADIQKGFAVIVVSGTSMTSILTKLLWQSSVCSSPHLEQESERHKALWRMRRIACLPQALLGAGGRVTER